MSLEQMYTIEEVAESLKCSTWFVKDRVRKGFVSPMRLGTAVNAPLRFSAADVAKLRDSLTPAKPQPRRRGRAVA